MNNIITRGQREQMKNNEQRNNRIPFTELEEKTWNFRKDSWVPGIINMTQKHIAVKIYKLQSYS